MLQHKQIGRVKSRKSAASTKQTMVKSPKTWSHFHCRKIFDRYKNAFIIISQILHHLLYIFGMILYYPGVLMFDMKLRVSDNVITFNIAETMIDDVNAMYDKKIIDCCFCWWLNDEFIVFFSSLCKWFNHCTKFLHLCTINDTKRAKYNKLYTCNVLVIVLWYFRCLMQICVILKYKFVYSATRVLPYFFCQWFWFVLSVLISKFSIAFRLRSGIFFLLVMFWSTNLIIARWS